MQINIKHAKIGVISLILYLYACKERPHSFIMPDETMASTINGGATVYYAKKEEVSRNDLIAFRLPKNDKITCERVIGIPGDKIEIRKGKIFVNDKEIDRVSSSKTIYAVYSKDPGKFSQLSGYEYKPYSDNYGMIKITKGQYLEISGKKMVDSIYELGFDSSYEYPGIVKTKSSTGLNHYYFGPVFIPKAGDTLMYDDRMLLNGYSPFDSPYFVIDDAYYFCIGDSFSDAMDSRIFGLVPKKRVLGVVTNFEKTGNKHVDSN